MRTCLTCRHALTDITGHVGCGRETRVEPVTGYPMHRLCSSRRGDPMDACGPAGKLWQEQADKRQAIVVPVRERGTLQ